MMVLFLGYPLVETPIPFDGNQMTTQRCHLARLTAEINDLAFQPHRSADKTVFYDAVTALGLRGQRWLQRLPDALRYDNRAPSGLFEF